MAELTEPAEYVRMDLFPCTVEGPQGTLGPEARIILTDNHFYVFVDAPLGPEAILKVKHEAETDYTGSLKDGFQIGEYRVVKNATCGCGSRLRSFYPFLGVPHHSIK